VVFKDLPVFIVLNYNISLRFADTPP